MNKDYLRDYATAAFRFYACNGQSAEKYKKLIYEDALQKQGQYEKSCDVSKPTEAAIVRAEAAVNQKLAEIRDMEAVEMTLAELHGYESFNESSSRASRHERIDIVQAIKIVYFTDADMELSPGDIQDRVHMAELSIPASERSIYRYLKKARILFAEKRGLRLNNKS